MPITLVPATRLFSSTADIILRFLIKKNFDLCSKSKSAKKLSFKLQNLIVACQQNLHHIKKLQKEAHNKSVKPQNYISNNKVWLNS